MSQNPSEPLLLCEKEAARLLGFSYRTLQKWRVVGRGPRFVRAGGAKSIRYRRCDLERWIADGLRDSTSNPGLAEGGKS